MIVSHHIQCRSAGFPNQAGHRRRADNRGWWKCPAKSGLRQSRLDPLHAPNGVQRPAQVPLASIECEALQVVAKFARPLQMLSPVLEAAETKDARREEPCELQPRPTLQAVGQWDAAVVFADGFLARHECQKDAAGAQNAANLSQSTVQVFDMLKDHVRTNGIKGSAGEGQQTARHFVNRAADFSGRGERFAAVIIDLKDVGTDYSQAPKLARLDELTAPTTEVQHPSAGAAFLFDLRKDEPIVRRHADEITLSKTPGQAA